ncbi:MAG: hypothetical protein HY718_19930, partial [Planctomycetes bacterium]|nr:hypothetical protein [Planctomycetota bacterium]
MNQFEPSSSDVSSPTSQPKRLHDCIRSIWFGVTMLAIIFLYSSIGSASPPVRQGILADWLGIEWLRFEKTEMQWFAWWPFQAMLGLLCVGLVLATLRIRLNVLNAGVWVIHSGILMLAISSVVYFSSKIEGEAVIFHSRALVLAPGMTEPTSFVVRPEARGIVGVPGHYYDIRVVQLDPGYVIPEGANRGRKTTAVWLAITPANAGQRFARLLLLGYPELTEDYLIESGGVVRAAERQGGRPLVDEGLQIQLWYDPAEYFYLNDTAAVYARFSSDDDWTELRIDGMAKYYEHVDDTAAVWPEAGEPMPPPRPLDLKPRAVGEAASLAGIDLRVTGYLPYASDKTVWLPGGERLNPMLRFRVKAPFAETQEELLARVPGRNVLRLPTGQTIAFEWADDADALARRTARPVPRLGVKVKSLKLDQTINLADLEGEDAVPLAGTDYSIRLQRTMPAGAAGSESPAGLLVHVHKRDAEFHRLVFDGRGDGGLDLDDQLNVMPQPVDADLELEYLD